MKRTATYFLFFLLLILVAVHLFFLNADAFSFFEIGRGAYTDEGWHSYQLRNWMNGHGFHLLATDSFLKAPFFNLLLLPFFSLLGQQLWVGKIVLIVFSLMPFLFYWNTKRNVAFYFLLFFIAYTQPLVFCYQHYLLPEMLAITVILSGILFLQEHFETNKWKFLYFGVFSFVIAFLLKAQFVYVLVLPLAYAFFYTFSDSERSAKLKVNGIIFSTLILSFFLYFLLWYYPNKAGFEYYFSLLSHGQYTNLQDSWERAKYYYYDWLSFQPFWKSYVTIFWFSFLIGVGLFCFIKASKFFRVVFFLSCIWVLLETHKFLAAYIPVRYVLPLIVAALVTIAVVFYELLQLFFRNFDKPISKITVLFVLLTTAFLVSKNMKWDYEIYSQRTFEIDNAKRYLQHHLKSDDKVLGNWSPALCMGLKNEVRTISYGVNDWKTVYEKYKPTVVISEENQAESDSVFTKLNVDLAKESDSVKSFNIAAWKLHIYWVKNKSYEKK